MTALSLPNTRANPQRRPGGAITQDAGATPSTAVAAGFGIPAEFCTPAPLARETSDPIPSRSRPACGDASGAPDSSPGAALAGGSGIDSASGPFSAGATYLGYAARINAEWAALCDAGLTGAEAARHRGVTQAAASIWARKAGRKWTRAIAVSPMKRLSDAERTDYRLLLGHGYRTAEALTAIGRTDLIGSPE